VRVIWTLGAQEDARGLVLELATRSAVAADRLTEALALAAERLSDFPRLGVGAGGRHRHLLIVSGAYRLVYREDEDAIRILGVIWGSSQWPSSRA
jgi:plasmid stabilization system protein ParE